MTVTGVIDRLAEHKTVDAAPREELAWLVSHGSVQHLSEGEVLSAKGAPVAGLFVVLTGHLAIFVDRGGAGAGRAEDLIRTACDHYWREPSQNLKRSLEPQALRNFLRRVFHCLAASGNLHGKFDLVACDLALVVQLDVVALKICVDRKRQVVSIDLPVLDRRLAHHFAAGLAGQLVTLHFENECPLDGSIWGLSFSLPCAAYVGSERGKSKHRHPSQ
jgi:hypothetical protein